jgi:Stress responsive A/B Barrel Domain
MVAHIVLFRPKPETSEADRQAMFDALRIASTEIPSVRQFHVGQRVQHGSAYENLMAEDYPYAAVVEFEDLDGLNAYLSHPRHDKLGELFYALLEAALVCDYEMKSPVNFMPLRP